MCGVIGLGAAITGVGASKSTKSRFETLGNWENYWSDVARLGRRGQTGVPGWIRSGKGECI